MPAFVPELSVILTFGLASFVLAITPGPDMALFISRTLNHGRPHGFATVFGAFSGIVIHTVLAAFGISLLLVASPLAFLALKIAGALYLLWLAIDAIRTNKTLTFAARSGRTPSLRQSYLTGIGINLTNPKIVLFFITFLPQFVSAADPAAAAKLVFLGAEFFLVSLPVVIAIVIMAEMLAGLLTRSPLVQRVLNFSFAAVFAGFAVAILTLEGRR